MAEDDGKIFGPYNIRQMRVLIRKPFSFEQEEKPINGMFEVSLGRRFASFVELVEVILDLFRLKFCGQAAEM